MISLGVLFAQCPVDTSVLLTLIDTGDVDLLTVDDETIPLGLDDGLGCVDEVRAAGGLSRGDAKE